MRETFTHAFQIVHSVHERFRGLPSKLSAMTGKSQQWFGSHGLEPKSVNPLSSGSISEVEHFMRYCRLFEGAVRGAGRYLIDRVHHELTLEFADDDADASQGEIHAEMTSEVCDVSVWLSRFDMDTASLPQLRAFETECDEALDAIERAKAAARAKRRVISVERDKTRTLAPPADVAKFRGNGTK